MQGVQREFEFLIQAKKFSQSTQSVDEVAQTQQGDDNAQISLSDEVNDGLKGPRQ